MTPRPVTRFVDTQQPLQNRLKLSVVRPVLLYDTSEKRAWLVPTVCILLHMMHLRSRELSKHHKPSTEEDIPDMPRAKIGGDSADEAYEVLTHFLEDGTVTSLGSSEIWTETLARYYICLDMALNESMKMKETSSSRDTNIFGFELMGIVLSESPFRFTERKVGRESGRWTKLARDVGYALFCSGLGNAIMPGTGGNELCRNWSSLPSNFDYLAAYIPCLIDVLQRQGWPCLYFAKRCVQQRNEQLDKVVHEVRSWFSRDGNCNWLLLYDNVDRENIKSIDDPEAFDISAYLPECDQGSIIITTRQFRLRTLGDEMSLGEMRGEEGLEVLESRIGKSLKGQRFSRQRC